MPRAKGSKNRRTLERETANKIASARAEFVKNAPPPDFSVPLDSLEALHLGSGCSSGRSRHK
jgi:hypothetical protein